MAPRHSTNLRRWLDVGLIACGLAWSAFIAVVVYAASDGRQINAVWQFLSLPLAVATILTGGWRIAVWLICQQQINAFGQQILDERGDQRGSLRSVFPRP